MKFIYKVGGGFSFRIIELSIDDKTKTFRLNYHSRNIHSPDWMVSGSIDHRQNSNYYVLLGDKFHSVEKGEGGVVILNYCELWFELVILSIAESLRDKDEMRECLMVKNSIFENQINSFNAFLHINFGNHVGNKIQHMLGDFGQLHKIYKLTLI